VDDMKKCNRVACLWFLYSFDFSRYTGQHHWERVKLERESCPRECEKYIEHQIISEDVKRILAGN
jgi:hypothetical protein